ncbi:MAG: hypothetical protein A3B74_05410 [Candidatus Kerfeldbacteria bacterium RIFCSPHIGHO2_02_FULL_42_14]|uniref:DDH domain-containing protein n=1 Tax=Candidatus Kerfeldbacteria bacterium RIFCSPHIGHO2_02_FULL_42_14 TaxID=1798540 RepID=A0A1G2AVS4_9BACT|nr:MAG: hypothetical protein A3B74_05410 [Candidatus Kerfeldbacteria bacterium RIFCSPHIGHO2_02_FULL_42_14]OGY83175.1 MAG: hypothetical protein A3I91_03245 [Candidatus Kerfeldbacteria bacterium RIFCSPLOWO2_02_FULL_42_19]
MNFAVAHRALMQASSVLLVSHQNPDGDTLGSALAMAQFLIQQGKKCTHYCATPLAQSFAFLPGYQRVTMDRDRIAVQHYDVMIVFDAGDLTYAGVQKLLLLFTHKPYLINIDHHATNTLFGDLNLVDVSASSTAEIVYALLMSFKVTLTSDIATNLLMGIMTDTGHFSNLATTSRSLHIAAKLLNLGAHYKAIYVYLHAKSLQLLRLWGKILSRLQKNSEWNVVYTFLTHEDLEALEIEENEALKITNFLNIITNVRAVLFLYERSDGMIKGSFRTTHPLIDVAKIAKLLGGGGHTKAAGFLLPGKIQITDGSWQIV